MSRPPDIAATFQHNKKTTMAAPPPQSFPYDYLFKVLIIGDASVGKVR